MATLSTDTPTLHNLNSNSHSYPVDNETEQGVLDVLPTQNPTPEANGKDECVINLENDKNMNAKNTAILPMNIKIEPSLDIDDGIIMDGENSNPLCSPKIRLTPTSKLLATETPFKIAKKYACPYENCTKSYGKSSHLRSHLTWHTGIKPYVCQEPGCGKGFTRSDELNRHTRTHTGEKPFECVQCTKKFSRSDHLSKHLATHAKQLNNPTGANKSKAQPRPVIKIMQKPPVVRAPSVTKNPCVEGMHFLAALADHHTSTEPPEDLTEEAPLTIQPIKIKVEKNDSGDEFGFVPFKDDLNNAYGKAKSPISPDLRCPVSPSLLVPEVRMEAAGQHDGDDGNEDEPDDDTIMPEANLPPYPQSIKASAALLNGPGRSQYDPIRPYKCPMCLKLFKRQDDLNRHVRCHTGEKPFMCTECDRAFKRTDHLKKHMNIHTRLR